MSEWLSLLRRHPYFASLPPEILAEVASHARLETHEKGDVIFLEGEPVQGLHLVASGSVRVFKSSEDGKEQVLHHMGVGQSFADVAALDGRPSPANAQAAQRTTVLLVPRADLMDLLRRFPELALAVIQGLAARLRQMSGLIEELSLRHVTARMAALLLRLAEGQAALTVPTRQELAAMAGTVREVATRALKNLERLGAIRCGTARRVTILNAALLKRLGKGVHS